MEDRAENDARPFQQRFGLAGFQVRAAKFGFALPSLHEDQPFPVRRVGRVDDHVEGLRLGQHPLLVLPAREVQGHFEQAAYRGFIANRRQFLAVRADGGKTVPPRRGHLPRPAARGIQRAQLAVHAVPAPEVQPGVVQAAAGGGQPGEAGLDPGVLQRSNPAGLEIVAIEHVARGLAVAREEDGLAVGGEFRLRDEQALGRPLLQFRPRLLAQLRQLVPLVAGLLVQRPAREVREGLAGHRAGAVVEEPRPGAADGVREFADYAALRFPAGLRLRVLHGAGAPEVGGVPVRPLGVGQFPLPGVERAAVGDGHAHDHVREALAAAALAGELGLGPDGGALEEPVRRGQAGRQGEVEDQRRNRIPDFRKEASEHAPEPGPEAVFRVEHEHVRVLVPDRAAQVAAGLVDGGRRRTGGEEGEAGARDRERPAVVLVPTVVEEHLDLVPGRPAEDRAEHGVGGLAFADQRGHTGGQGFLVVHDEVRALGAQDALADRHVLRPSGRDRHQKNAPPPSCAYFHGSPAFPVFDLKPGGAASAESF